MRKDAYDRVAADARANPNTVLARIRRSWICRWHIKYGGMPPHDLRADWPNIPSWAK